VKSTRKFRTGAHARGSNIIYIKKSKFTGSAVDELHEFTAKAPCAALRWACANTEVRIEDRCYRSAPCETTHCDESSARIIPKLLACNSRYDITLVLLVQNLHSLHSTIKRIYYV